MLTRGPSKQSPGLYCVDTGSKYILSETIPDPQNQTPIQGPALTSPVIIMMLADAAWKKAGNSTDN